MGGSGVIDQFLNIFTTYIDSGFGLLCGDVRFLSQTLIALDITLAGLFWALAGEEDVIARLIKKTLYIGFFAFLIGNFNRLAKIIFDSFSGLGPKAAGSGLSAADFLHPGRIAQVGLDAGKPIWRRIYFRFSSPGRSLMTPFRRPSVRYGKTPEPETPYQKAAQVWDDRIGSARVQAKNWRLIAFGNLALAAGVAAGLVWQSARGTIVPWVVQVDRFGAAQAVAPAIADYRPTDPQIAWHLARFIEEVRGITTDPVIVRQNWLQAYDFVTDKGALALNDYARSNEPFAKVGRVQVATDVSSVIRASGDSFRVAWTERRYENGSLAATEHWTAILTIVVEPPRDAERLRKNPLGVFIHAINWSKELG
jgi:type IV secretion system protein TrbF